MGNHGLRTSPTKLGVAFALVIGAGLATALGASFVFLADRLNKRLLAAALAGSTGVMLYVSFVEIFSVKAIGAFEEAGHSTDKATIYATCTFFGGMAITYLLDKLVHIILHAMDRFKANKQGGDAALMNVCVAHVHTDDCDPPSTSHDMHKSPSASLRRRVGESGEGRGGEDPTSSDLVHRAVVNLARKSHLSALNEKSSRSSFDHASISTESDVDAVGLRAMDVLQRPEGDPSLHDPKTGARLPSIMGHESEFNRELRHELQASINPRRAHPEIALPRESGCAHPDAKNASPSPTGRKISRHSHYSTQTQDGVVHRTSGNVAPLHVDSNPSAQDKVLPPELEDDHHAGLAKVGLLTAIALFIHNGPEGLATFVAAIADFKAGAALAFAVLLHNIPEGMCVAFPIYYATGSKWKGLLWGVLSAVSEPLGGLVGLGIIESGLSPIAYGVLFGVVAGMMVFISLVEVYPSAIKFDPGMRIVMPCMVGGMALIALSLLMFKF